MNRILLFVTLLVFGAGHAQVTLDYDTQTGSFNATRTINTNSSYYAGAYNYNATEMGTYANGSGGGYVGDPGVAVFRTFTTAASANSGTARPMQVGDEFSITCYVNNSNAFFNNSSAGISFNGGTASSAFSNYNTLQRAKFQINKNDGGLNGNWFSAASGSGSGYATPGQDVIFKIKLTSAKTVNMSISSANGATSYDMVLANTPGTSNNIQSFVIWNQTSGSGNDIFWNNASLKSTGTVEIGNGNGTSTFDGAITDGFIPNSTTVSNANVVTKSGTGIITFSANNTYTGNTRINGGSIKLSGSGTLGVGSNVYISSGASLDLNGVNATVASVQETGSNNGGTIALGSGTLTISGGWSGSIYQNSISGSGSLVKQGSGTLSLYGTQAFSGSVTVSGGELASSVALSSSNYTINGGTLSWNASNIIPDAATVSLSSGTLNVNQDETINNLTITGGKVIVAPGKILTINGDLSLTLENQISLGSGAAIRYGSNGKLIYNASGAVWVSAKEWPTTFGPSSVAITSGAVSLTGNRTITDNLSVTNSSFDLFLYSLSRETVGGELAVGAGAYLLIGSTGTLPANFSAHTFAPTSTIYYNGYAGQTVAQPSSPYGNVTIANSGTKTLQGNIQLTGNFTLYNAVFDLQEYTMTRLTPGGSITINNGATLKIGGTNIFPTGFASVSLNSGSNVDYAGNSQEIAALSSSYGHLTLSGTGAKTLAGSVIAQGNLTVNSVTLTVAGGQNLTVNGNVANNGGTIVFENNANLLQGAATTVNGNTGTINVHRDGSELYRGDYTMWASPVAGQGLSAFSPATLSDRFYIYNTATNQFNSVASSGTFAAGKGYLIRMPNGAFMPDNTTLTGTINGTPAAYQQGTATMTFNGLFTGVPNNGDITIPLSTSADGYNLVGNPYPSPVSLAAFRSGNSNAIDGNVWIWRKTNSSPNSAYVTINSAGIYTGNGAPEQEDPNGIIRTGQGFIVKLKSGYTTSDLVFTNSMRSTDTANQFFRMNNPQQETQSENHGIWLNLNGPGGVFSQMYAGYIAGATLGEDTGLDAPYINDKPVVLASIINTKEYTIQARALPFDAADVVPLQLRTATAGDYTISIDHVNGLFAQGQVIYLKDNYTNAYHNLTEGNYTFSTSQGTFADRFEVVFVPQAAMGTTEAKAETHNVIAYPENGAIKIDAGYDEIMQLQVFDVRGRQLFEAEGNGSSTYTISGIANTRQVLLVRITTNYGIKIKKLVQN